MRMRPQACGLDHVFAFNRHWPSLICVAQRVWQILFCRPLSGDFQNDS